MTIRVVKPPPQPHLTCRGCKAELEFDISDLTPAFFERDYTEDGPKGVGIECPNCRVRTQWKEAPAATVDFVWVGRNSLPEDPVLARGHITRVQLSDRSYLGEPIDNTCTVAFQQREVELGLTTIQAERVRDAMVSRSYSNIGVALVLESPK